MSALLLLTESILMNNDYEVLLSIVNNNDNDSNQIIKSYLYPLAELERKYPIYNEYNITIYINIYYYLYRLGHTLETRRRWLDILGYYYIIKATDAKQFKRQEEAEIYIKRSVELFNQIIPIDVLLFIFLIIINILCFLVTRKSGIYNENHWLLSILWCKSYIFIYYFK